MTTTGTPAPLPRLFPCCITLQEIWAVQKAHPVVKLGMDILTQKPRWARGLAWAVDFFSMYVNCSYRNALTIGGQDVSVLCIPSFNIRVVIL